MSGNNAHLYDLINQYEAYRKEFDGLPIYKSYHPIRINKYEGEKQRILGAMKRAETSLRIVAHKNHPMLVAADIDILLSNLKAHVSPPQPPKQDWEFDPAR